MKAVVITVSTKGYLGEREDKSDPALRARLEKIGFTVTKQLLLPDDREKLRVAMKEIADGGEAELIVTTGGTGFAKDDCTPEATLDIVERRADGIPEAMRAYSSQFTDRAMLSRAAAGIRGETVIINLPGSVKAVEECMDCVQKSLIHGIEILTGRDAECGR